MSDKIEFKNVMASLAAMYRKELSNEDLKIYWQAIGSHSPDRIRAAVDEHSRDPKHGQYFPSPIVLRNLLEPVVEITPDKILEHARLAKTPLGVLARIKIGSFDLQNQGDFYLKARASECMQEFAEWRARAMAGEYTDHEISVMVKHGVDPTAGFTGVHDAPRDVQRLQTRVSIVKHADKQAMLPSPDEKRVSRREVPPEIRKQLRKVLKGMPV